MSTKSEMWYAGYEDGWNDGINACFGPRSNPPGFDSAEEQADYWDGYDAATARIVDHDALL